MTILVVCSGSKLNWKFGLSIGADKFRKLGRSGRSLLSKISYNAGGSIMSSGVAA